LSFLLQQLGLRDRYVDNIRYQLLHRTVSAVIEAKRFNAKHALMLVHSFSQYYEHFEDYENFVGLFGLQGKKDTLIGPIDSDGLSLYFGWVKGDKKFLIK